MDDESGVLASPEDLERDLALIAEANGWTLEEATERHRTAIALGEILGTIARERPTQYVGAALGERPGDPATLYVKGPADEFIRDLVRVSGVDAVVADNQPFSFDELEERKLRVHRALETLGFGYVATAVNITGGGIIPAGVTAEAGLPSTAASIIAALPADLRDSVELTIREEPVVRTFSGFGDMWVLDNGVKLCTSGWSVRGINTVNPGITTAAHCNSMDHVEHPGHGTHALSFKGQHHGEWGDVEWHDVVNQSEPDDFYATATEIRVTGVQARSSIVLGTSVCVYGRQSNYRNCSLEVQDVSHGCTRPNGQFVDRMVAMNGVVSSGGDSGGGWSLGNYAWGSVVGTCAIDYFDREVWSVADLYDEAILVRVAK